MLNRLYSVMDFLAKKFNLFKVETIGDAYVCCSGLPETNEKHAQNVANFAVAVQHCAKLVSSPVDSTPIELRIGIHSGPCASGVVGVTNPRYCVFGDTVNTTSRHESTGEPGRIHCSRECRMELLKAAKDSFQMKERGLVEMKGKGQLQTFWLEASHNNKYVNKCGLMKLQDEVQQMLHSTKSFDNNVEKMLEKSNLCTGDYSMPSPRSKMRLFELERSEHERELEFHDLPNVTSEKSRTEFSKSDWSGKANLERPKPVSRTSVTSLTAASSVSDDSDASDVTPPITETRPSKCPFHSLERMESTSRMYFM